jgi:small subunit ribosomal protein S18
MPQRREKKSPSAKDRRPIKKKMSILNSENIQWIDYKDVNLLRRFMSERAKIRARRVTGNDQQQQAAVAKAIKLAREMALLPYSVRQVTQRSKGRRDRGDRGDRGELRLPSSAPSSPQASSASEEFGDELVLDALETEFDAPEVTEGDFGDNGLGENGVDASATADDAATPDGDEA